MLHIWMYESELVDTIESIMVQCIYSCMYMYTCKYWFVSGDRNYIMVSTQCTVRRITMQSICIYWYLCMYVLVWASGDRKSGRVGIRLHHRGDTGGAHYSYTKTLPTPPALEGHLCSYVTLPHGPTQPGLCPQYNYWTPLECVVRLRYQISQTSGSFCVHPLLIRSTIGLCWYFDVKSTYGQCFQMDMMSCSIVE